MENENFKKFVTIPCPGDVLTGQIIAKDKNGLFLAIDNFATGVVRGKELSRAKDTISDLKIGDEIAAKILTVNTDDGLVELSISQAEKEKVWLDLKKKKNENESFTIKALKANKGGLTTEIKGIAAFLPVSQLSAEHYPKVPEGDQAEILRKLQQLIGKELLVKIIGLDLRQKSIILSEKAVNIKDQTKILKKYKKGDVVQGEIVGLSDFGAFIRFPSSPGEETLEGLIHISELDWHLVHDPSEIVKEGDIVSAKIIDISNDKVSLSLKALKKDPWENIEQKYKKGDVVKGEVVRFNPFGAFIKIEPDIQALCHISEFKNVKEMKEMLELGKEYQFRISLIDQKEHKMILTPHLS